MGAICRRPRCAKFQKNLRWGNAEEYGGWSGALTTRSAAIDKKLTLGWHAIYVGSPWLEKGVILALRIHHRPLGMNLSHIPDNPAARNCFSRSMEKEHFGT